MKQGRTAAVCQSGNTDRRFRTTSLNRRIIAETIRRHLGLIAEPEHKSVFVNNRIRLYVKRFQMYGYDERVKQSDHGRKFSRYKRARVSVCVVQQLPLLHYEYRCNDKLTTY